MSLDPRLDIIGKANPNMRSSANMADLQRRINALEQTSPKPNFVTAIPANPFDGQTINYFGASDGFGGIVWSLRYRASSGSSHKWEFIGGRPILLYSTGAQVVTTLVNDNAGSVTLPLAGNYLIAWGVQGNSNAAAGYMNCFLNVGGSNSLSRPVVSYTANYGAEINGVERRTANASDAVVLQFSIGGPATSSNVVQRYISITPMDVG